jgi:hypothetical protein
LCLDIAPPYVNGHSISDAASELLMFIRGGNLFREEPLSQFHTMLFTYGLTIPSLDRRHGLDQAKDFIETVAQLCGMANILTAVEVARMLNFSASVVGLSMDMAVEASNAPAYHYGEQMRLLEKAKSNMHNTGNMGKLMRFGNGYLARGSHSVQPGDEIWQLYSGKVLYTLQLTSKKTEYTFIGEAYVQGIMFGEFLEKKLNIGQQLCATLLV